MGWYDAIVKFKPEFKIIRKFYIGDDIDVDTVDLYVMIVSFS